MPKTILIDGQPMGMFTYKSVIFENDSKAYTVPAVGSNTDVSKDVTPPSGYTLVGVINAVSGTANVMANGYVYNNKPSIAITNVSSSVTVGQSKNAQWTNVYAMI